MSESVAAVHAIEPIRDVMAGRAALSKIYLDDDLERIRMVRTGIPARIVRTLSVELDLPKEAVYGLLVKVGENMLPEDADAQSFDAARWVARWLEEPQPALHGETPASFLDTADGRRLVRKLLGQMETGAYA